MLSVAVSHYFIKSPAVWLFVCGPPSSGKCLGVDTPVLMYDGTIKRVQDVVIGDVLMGDDSTPRTVLKLYSGLDQMYKVVPARGDSYKVNQEHILSLQARVHEDRRVSIDIPIKDFIRSTPSFRKYFLGYRVGVDFPATQNSLPIHPYILGCWLGDGTSKSAGFTTVDRELVDKINSLLPPELKLRKYNTKVSNCAWGISTGKKQGGRRGRVNEFLNGLKGLNLIGNKHIPHAYLTASREQRFELLAGLLDTDGNVSNNTYEFVQKREHLTDQLIFLARSLGFTANKTTRTNTWTYKGKLKSGTYFRAGISGKDLEQIPVVIPRKKIVHPKKESSSHTRLTAEAQGIGAYYGFELSGNGRFLLGDFTVTHNTTLFIDPLISLPRAERVDDISPKTLLSGMGKGFGLLDKLGGDGKHGILLFPDFNTLVSLRDDDKKQIAGQLRRVFDGHLDKDVGSLKTKLTWTGKVTTIAAITEEGERQWGLMRALGERFLTVRIKRGDAVPAALKAMKGNHAVAIKDKLSSLVQAVVSPASLKAPNNVITNPEQIVALAEVVSLMRGHVVRDSRGSREIILVPEPEAPARTAYSLAQVAFAHAALFRESNINGTAIKAVKRLALDSIPPGRRSILDCIKGGPVTLADIEQTTKRPRSSLEWSLDELMALGLMENAAGNTKAYQLTPEFQSHMETAELIAPTVIPLHAVKQ